MAKNTRNAKKTRGRARDTGKAVPISLELPPHIDASVERYKLEHGSSKRWIVIRALEMFLAKTGTLAK